MEKLRELLNFLQANKSSLPEEAVRLLNQLREDILFTAIRKDIAALAPVIEDLADLDEILKGKTDFESIEIPVTFLLRFQSNLLAKLEAGIYLRNYYEKATPLIKKDFSTDITY